MELLRVEQLTKQYGSGANKVLALDHVSFSVEKGEFIAIIGASGSGKSTLLHLIGGVDQPSSGSVYINGADLYSQDEEALAIFRRRQVGLIYQFYNLIPVLTVEENITLPVLMDQQEVNHDRLEELLSPWSDRTKKPSSEPAFRRTAAARLHRPRTLKCTVYHSRRRTYRQS